MAIYKLRMSSIEARTDGAVRHDMWVLDDSDQQRLHKDVLIPHAILDAALSTGTTNQKVTAYKSAIWDYRNYKPESVNTSEWEFSLLEGLIGAVNQAAAAMFFITDTLGLSLPFDFTIEG